MAAQRGVTGSAANTDSHRRSAAFGLWVVGFFPPLFIPVVSASAMSPLAKGIIAGLLVFGLPQLFTAFAVALVGRTGMQRLLSQMRLGARGWTKRLSPSPANSLVSFRRGDRS